MLELENKIDDLASIVKRLGNPISTILLHTSCSTFEMSHIDGIIGYQLIKNFAVVIGDPICLPQNVAELTQAFHQYCQERHLRIIYFLVSDFFANWALKNGYCQTLIQAGEELVIDPTKFRKKQKLRWKINQSLQRGVMVKEYKGVDPHLEDQMKKAIVSWLKAKRGPQIHLGDLHFFATDADKRIFYAQQADAIIGLLKLSPIERSHGWVLTSFLATPEAPVGTSEHLMSCTFDTLSKENCHFLCLGAISGSGLGTIVGLNKLSKFYARLIFKISKWFFSLEAKRVYLSKYHPHLSPTYILFSGNLSLMELMAIKEVLNVRL